MRTPYRACLHDVLGKVQEIQTKNSPKHCVEPENWVKLLANRFNVSPSNMRNVCIQILFLRVPLLANLVLFAKITKFNTR